jgi:hypothetical protein
MSSYTWEEYYELVANDWSGGDAVYEGDVCEDALVILNKHPTKEHAQQGLDGLIRACIVGCRYAIDEIETFGPLVEQFMKMGAIVNVNDIIKPEYSDYTRFEDDAYFTCTKAELLKLFSQYGIDIPNEIRQATPIYWEEMMDNNFRLMSKYTYTEAYYNSIKYYI